MKVAGGISCDGDGGGRLVQEVEMGDGARAVGVVGVVVGVVLSGGREVGGEVAVVVGIGRVGRLGRRSYRQARALHMAKILLFSIVSVHFGLNIPSGANELGLSVSSGRVKRMGAAWQWLLGGRVDAAEDRVEARERRETIQCSAQKERGRWAVRAREH